MSQLFTQCTGCNAKLKIKSPDAAGKKIRCPKCKEVFIVKLMKAKSAARDEDKEPSRKKRPAGKATTASAKKPSREKGKSPARKPGVANHPAVLISVGVVLLSGQGNVCKAGPVTKELVT